MRGRPTCSSSWRAGHRSRHDARPMTALASTPAAAAAACPCGSALAYASCCSRWH
ncbi:MAG: hypothetical protein EOP35_09375, partial [Rubrivivax sp.]